MAPKFHNLSVRDTTPLTADACQITLDVPPELSDAFAFRPGQYLTLQCHINDTPVRRSYSISSQPGQPLAVGIRRVDRGAFSTFATGALAAGDAIQVLPPQGRFCAPQIAGQSLLLIAAGSGITPMMSIAASVLADDPGTQVTLVYGNRNGRSIMFHEQLEDLKDRYLGRFTLIHILSREEQDVPLLNGRIDEKKLTTLSHTGAIAPASADAILLCGPADMISTATAAMTALGADPKIIRTEYFLTGGQTPKPRPAPTPAARPAGGTDVEVTLDGRRHSFVMSQGDTSVIDSAARAGFEIPFSCKGGMCCTCRCRIIEGTAEMALNYSLEPWEVKAGYTLACQARPTSGRLVLDFDET